MASDLESPSKYRRPRKWWRLLSICFSLVGTILAVIYLFHLTPFGLLIFEPTYRYLLVAAFLPLCFIWTPISSKAPKDTMPWYDVLFFLISLAIPVFFAWHAKEILLGAWAIIAPPAITALGFILWLLVVEAARRGAGSVFAAIVAFFAFYPLFADHLPGLLKSSPWPIARLTNFHVMGTDSLMGLPMRVFGDFFISYMVYATVVQVLGAEGFFNGIALALVGNTRAGIAKVAIVGSALFGTISGSAVANVYMTGSFTIPAMKAGGIRADMAAAIEANASTGGIIMPPVMGSVAFLMAEFIGVSYAEICIAAAIPAVLFYVCLFAHIDSYAARAKIKPPVITVEVPPVWRTLVNNLHIVVSFIVIVLWIFIFRLTSQAPLIAAVFAIVVGMFRKETRLTPQRFLKLFEDAGRILSELMATMGAVGLIIGSLVLTGLAFSLPYVLMSLAGGNIYLLLIFAAIAGFILGMGVTPVGVYVFLAIAAAPALIMVGLNTIAVHLFVVYWAMLSCVTPPVAVAAFAAASIAQINPMKAGLTATRLGASKYLLPFIFVLSPAFILEGTLGEMIPPVITCLIGFIIISAAIEGYLWWLGTITVVSRIVLSVAGLLLAWPSLNTDLYGAGIILLFLAAHYLLRRRKTSRLR